MAKKKKKPSKRGKKAYKISLHCSPMIVTQEKKIKKFNTGEEDKKIGKMD